MFLFPFLIFGKKAKQKAEAEFDAQSKKKSAEAALSAAAQEKKAKDDARKEFLPDDNAVCMNTESVTIDVASQCSGEISGKSSGSAGDIVKIYMDTTNVDWRQLGQATVDVKGNWKLVIDAGTLTFGHSVSATLISKSIIAAVSGAKEVSQADCKLDIVKKSVRRSSSSSKIVGWSSAIAETLLVFVNGKEIGRTSVRNDGQWEIPVKSTHLAVGNVVEAKLKGGRVSADWKLGQTSR